jgi:hypothetical protein
MRPGLPAGLAAAKISSEEANSHDPERKVVWFTCL